MLETCSDDERLKIEQRWIEKLRSNDRKFGFNVAYPVRSLLPSPAMSEISKTSWQNKTTARNRRRGLAKKWREPEFRKGRLADQARGREIAKSRWQEPEFRKNQSAIRKAQWQNPEWKAERVKELKIKNAKAHTPKAKAKRSATLKALWSDPAFKAKHMARLQANAIAMTKARVAARQSVMI